MNLAANHIYCDYSKYDHMSLKGDMWSWNQGWSKWEKFSLTACFLHVLLNHCLLLLLYFRYTHIVSHEVLPAILRRQATQVSSMKLYVNNVSLKCFQEPGDIEMWRYTDDISSIFKIHETSLPIRRMTDSSWFGVVFCSERKKILIIFYFYHSSDSTHLIIVSNA